MTIATINPTTGETLQTFTPLTSQEIKNKIGFAMSAFQDYRLTSLKFRGKDYLRRRKC